MSRVLVVAAHPDDELLGLGGTLKKRVISGDEVFCIILGEGQTSRSSVEHSENHDLVNQLHLNARKAGEVIGFSSMEFFNFPDNRFDQIALLEIIQSLEKYLKKLRPEVVYAHHQGDRNIDHRISVEAVLTACRPIGDYSVKEIYAFETPSSTEWGFSKSKGIFYPNLFEDITDTIQDKLEAMSYYTSELNDFPHPRSLKALEIIAQRWGTVIGKRYAEAFEVIRHIR